MECNCSLCTKRGGLLAFYPGGRLHPDHAARKSRHLSFQQGGDRPSFLSGLRHLAFLGGESKGVKMVAINLRCVEDIDHRALAIKHVNGRDF